MDDKNIKRIIVILALIILFIILLIWSYIVRNPEEDEPIDVPMGNHGQSDKKEEIKEVYVQVDEKAKELKNDSVELIHILKNPKLNLNSLGNYYIYDGYYVFPSRNIKVKKSFDKTLNLVLLNDYRFNIVNGIGVNSEKSDIISKLGKPNYDSDDLMIYKTKDYYIMFNNKLGEVSIYFTKGEELDTFWTMYSMYLIDKDLKGFISGVIREYPAYTRYMYDSDGVELLYSELGIRIEFKQYGTENGVFLYTNYEANKDEFSKEKLSKLENIQIKNLNLLAREEIERTGYEIAKKEFLIPEKIYSNNAVYPYINVLDSYLQVKKEEANKDKKEYIEYKEFKKLSKYSIYYENNNSRYTFSNVSIMSKSNNKHYNLGTAKVADYILLTENYVFYSIINEGIFMLDINTGKIKEIIIDSERFELKYIMDDYLFFDNVKIKIF